MSKPKSNLLLIIIAVIFILFLGARSKRPKSEHPEFVVPEYGMRGAMPIGVQEYAVDDQTGLKVTAWYPALLEESHRQENEYAYTVKMGEPFGAVAIASYNGQAAANAPFNLADGPYPLVILSPGFSIGSSAYGWLGEHLASHSFVVISPDHLEHLNPEDQLWRSAITRPQEVVSVLRTLGERSGPGGIFDGLIDMERVAVVGHSYGGYTALAAGGAQINSAALESHCRQAMEESHEAAWICEMLIPHLADMADLAGLDQVPGGAWPAARDPRIAAVVSLAGDAFLFGQPGLAEIRVPVLAIGGTADQDSPYDWSTKPVFEHSSGPRKIEIALDGAEHMIFTASCDRPRWYLKPISGEFCSDQTWSRAYAHALSKHFVTAFLLAELQGSREAALCLSPAGVDISGVGYQAIGYGE